MYADNRYELRLRIAKGYDGFTETKTRLRSCRPPSMIPLLILQR
jgi:hypothetical protein